MTAAEILAEAAARGFRVTLNSTGDGLILWPGDDPPADLVKLLRNAKPQIIAVLQNERGRINHWLRTRSSTGRLAPVCIAAKQSFQGSSGSTSRAATSPRASMGLVTLNGWSS